MLGCSVHITILGGSHGSPDQRLPPKEGGGNLEQLQQNLAAAAESRWAAIGLWPVVILFVHSHGDKPVAILTINPYKINKDGKIMMWFVIGFKQHSWRFNHLSQGYKGQQCQ